MHTGLKVACWGASLVVRWLRVCLAIQGTLVQSLVREVPTRCRAAKAMHNYWACALEPGRHNYWAHVLPLLKPACLEPMLCNKRSNFNERSTHCNQRKPPYGKDPPQPINRLINKSLKKNCVYLSGYTGLMHSTQEKTKGASYTGMIHNHQTPNSLLRFDSGPRQTSVSSSLDCLQNRTRRNW